MAKKTWACEKCGFDMEASEGAIRANCLVCQREMKLDGAEELAKDARKKAE